MLKSMVFILGGLLVTAGVAALVLNQFTHDPHLRDIAFATAITLISAFCSMIPMALTRKSEAVVVFQAAFGGTVIHLLLTLAMGAAVHALHLVDRGVFLFLLLGFYWFSLIFVVTAMIRIFRHSAQFRAARQEPKGV
jgi:hypothetical protein